MTRIDFYIIEKGSEQAADIFICRLTEKAWSQNNAVYIHTMNEQHATKYDDLLWSFSETSFIPHQQCKSDDEKISEINHEKTVLLGHNPQAEVTHHHDVLINLHDESPSFFSQFERVAEIITTDENSKIKGRERYQFYRDRGYALETHKISL